MTIYLAHLGALAYEGASDPDLFAEDALRAVSASVAKPTSGMTDGEVAPERAMLRGAMRAYLEWAEAETDRAGAAPPTGAG